MIYTTKRTEFPQFLKILDKIVYLFWYKQSEEHNL